MIVVRLISVLVGCLVLMAPTIDAWGQTGPDSSVSELKLTDREKRWLTEHPVLRVAPDPDFPPVEWIDRRGRFRGLAADYLRLIEKKLKIRFEIVALKNWDEVLDRARNRQVDLLSAASPSRQRREYLLFSRPHIVLPGLIFMRKGTPGSFDLAGLRGKKVTVVSNYVWQDYLNNDYPDLALIAASSVADGLKKVSFGQADAMVGDLATATYYIQKEGITNLRVAGETGYFTYLSLASRKDWPLLAGILDKAIASISPEQSQAIMNRWLGVKPESWLTNPKVWIYLTSPLALLGLLLAGVMIWNRSLRKSVAAKTEELSRELAEREKAELALRESEEKFRGISAGALDAIIMIDPEGAVSFWNQAAEAMFGYSSREVMGREMHVLLAPPRQYAEYRQAFARFTQTGRGRVLGRTIELTALRRDGSEFPIELSISPLNMRGRWHAVGIVRDATARKAAEAERERLENQLLQSQKMEAVGTLAGGVAHDFNNILAAVIGYGELALHSQREGHPCLDHVTKILDTAERARELVAKLLTFSRKAESNFKPIDLEGQISATVDILRGTIPKMIHLDIRCSGQAKAIMADSSQIRQVFLNLGINAVDAMPEGGRLTIETESVEVGDEPDPDFAELGPGRYAEIRVADTGLGMDETVLRQAFEPFFTTKEVGKGTGLGLAMVFGIVKAHGGQVTCRSRPGEGTVFTIRLPLAAAAQGPADDADPALSDMYRGRETVLVVDDEDSVREVCRQGLGKFGYRTLLADSGEEALAVFRERGAEIDLVILDLGMPGMGGQACLEAILELDPAAKVIIASGYARSGDGAGASLERGAKTFLGKPYRLNDLLKTIRSILDADG